LFLQNMLLTETVGYISLNQTGASEIIVNNIGGGSAVSLTSDLEISKNSEQTTFDSTLKEGSTLTEGSVLGDTWSTSQELTGANFSNNNINTSEDSVLKAGSVIAANSTLAANSELEGDLTLSGDTSSTVGESIIAKDSSLQAGTKIGAETIGISIASAESTKIGHTTSSTLTLADNKAGTVDLSIFSNIQNTSYNVKSVDVAYNNSKESGMGAVADAINQLSDALGISAATVLRPPLVIVEFAAI